MSLILKFHWTLTTFKMQSRFQDVLKVQFLQTQFCLNSTLERQG